MSDRREVYSCGANDSGQLGIGTNSEYSDVRYIKGLEEIVQITAGESAMALDSKGKLFVWGLLSPDKVCLAPQKLGHINKRITAISMGKHCYSAIDSTSLVWVWGENKSAQLGLNDYTSRSTPYPLLSLKEKNVS